jgi:hypothetical protein
MSKRESNSSRQVDLLVLSPYDEVIGTVVDIASDSVTLDCTRRVTIRCPAESIRSVQKAVRLGSTVAILSLGGDEVRARKVLGGSTCK